MESNGAQRSSVHHFQGTPARRAQGHDARRQQHGGSENSSSPVYFTRRSGTVRNTASAMKASVPSEPISTLLENIYRPHRNRQSVQPVAGRVLHLVLGANPLAANAGFALDAFASTPAACGPALVPFRNCSSASGGAVSIAVPEGNTNVSDSSV